MKKTIIALAAVWATAFGASAVDYTHTLIINKTDGTKVEYKFADVPVATLEGDDLKIELLTTSENVLYPIADIVNFTFEKELSGVDNISSDEGRGSFGITREALDVSGLASDTEISIYNAAGMLCVKAVCGDNGTVSVDISTLDKGVYVVNAGNNIFKFIR